MHVSSSTNDPLKTWQDMAEQLSKATPASNTEFLKAILAPMQQQFEALQHAFEKQAEFQRDLTERILAPMKQMYAELQKAAETTHAAGEALQQAGTSSHDKRPQWTKPWSSPNRFSSRRSSRRVRRD
jgi:hypothetical protein